MIQVIVKPHGQQRESFWCGDYFWVGDLLKVIVSDTGNRDYNFYLFIHEALEGWSTNKRGIDEKVIHAFDVMFENEKKNGLHDPDDEPGDDPRCPYYRDHQFASAVEYLVCNNFGDNYQEYGKAIDKLFDKEGG